MKKKIIGRGNSSKKGNTCGRGMKGQKSRSGYSRKFFFAGGQTKINILTPKYGFRKKKNEKIKYIIKKEEIIINSNKYKYKVTFNNKIKKIFLLNIKVSKKLEKKITFLGGLII